MYDAGPPTRVSPKIELLRFPRSKGWADHSVEQAESKSDSLVIGIVVQRKQSVAHPEMNLKADKTNLKWSPEPKPTWRDRGKLCET